MSEEEIFADCANSAYLTALYNIINQIRYQRQPFCELRILIEGDIESENILKTMLIVDNQNPVYTVDYQKFLTSMTGAGTVGPSTTAGGAPPTYY